MHRALLLTLVLFTACSLKPIDPCADTSPLQLDPKVAEACAASETGDETNFVCVTPMSFDDYSICAPDTYDSNAWWVPKVTGDLSGSAVDHRDCTPAAEYQAWVSPDAGQQQPDYICSLPGNAFASPDGKAIALEEQPKNAWGYLRSLPTNGWTDASMATAKTAFGSKSVYCSKGALCARSKDDCFCRCESDLDCAGMTQAEAVCELGMCFYVDEPAAPAGAQPGPDAYGLVFWEDGIRLDGDAVTVSPAFLAALLPGAFRDDQSFDAAGTITHCGRASLCGHLGLAVGDTATASPDVFEQLVDGETVEVTIRRADGSTRTVSVSVAFAGWTRSP